MRVTLDRLLSKLGVASRAVGAAWIVAGRIRVNGRIERNPALWVSWPEDAVLLDDRRIGAAAKRFGVMHKPRGVITSASDERGRRTIFDVLPAELLGLHAVGRLDQATSGLLLLTNDTEISNYLTDPAHAVRRTYLVSVRGELTDAESAEAIVGVIDDGEHLRCHSVSIRKRSGRESHLEVVLVSGKNREIRRLFLRLGHEVTRLRRIGYGPFELMDLPVGGWLEIPIAEARRAVLR